MVYVFNRSLPDLHFVPLIVVIRMFVCVRIRLLLNIKKTTIRPTFYVSQLHDPSPYPTMLDEIFQVD